MDENIKLSCDIAVVGSGVSGLTAAVQAALLGKKVLVLETNKHIGGNWEASYGMMSVDSPLSRKQGVTVDAVALVNQEIRMFNYQVDSRLWRELAETSGENVAWLMDQGVEFEPELEPYTAGDINAPVFHRWLSKSYPSKKMNARLEALGGKVLTETKGKEIIFREGKVAGIKAERADGSELVIDCRAVISAGGGYAKNPEMVSKTIGIMDYATRGGGRNDGSAIQMCIGAGANSMLEHGTMIIDVIPRYMKRVSSWMTYIHSRPGSYPFHVNVNQDAKRYVDESGTLKLYAFSPAAAFTQEKSYTIYDDEKLKKLQEVNQNTVYDLMKTSADEGKNGICRADTFEELAEQLGMEPKTFAETMERYNSFCDNGTDKDFEKNAAFLQKFKPPFYGFENGYQVCATLDSIDYNFSMEVLDKEKKPIPGLYVAGADGAKLWRDYYSLAIPGSCNSNNIYSGRKAAKKASEYVSE